MSTWIRDVNDDSIIADFASEVGKDSPPTEGSWGADYASISKRLGVVPCPFVSLVSETKLRAYNCSLDLSSWRCALLACLTSGSNISEIVISGCAVTPQHLFDLSLALQKLCGQIRVLKVEYLLFPRGTDEGQRSEAFRALLSGDIRVEYISLQGNKIDDSFLQSAATDLQKNYSLKALNLSDNIVTDLGLTEIFRALRTNLTLIELSISRNQCTGEGSFVELATLLAGSAVSPEDDSAIKEIPKIVAEKNKAIKEVNKKRKKAGQGELAEVVIPAKERVMKVDGKLVLVNRSILTLDLSRNPLKAEFFVESIAALKAKTSDTALTSSFGSYRTTMLLTHASPEPLILPAQDITALQESGLNIVV